MSDKKKINLWSFGIEWDLNKTEDNIIQGKSNYDESISYLRITKNDTKKNIYYWIGKDKVNHTLTQDEIIKIKENYLYLILVLEELQHLQMQL